LISDSVVEVLEQRSIGRSGTIWTVKVRADDLLPLVTAAGPAARLTEIGAANSGALADLEVEVHESGFIRFISGDLDEWWTNAMSLLPLPTIDDSSADQQMSLRMTLRQPTGEVRREAPCQDPVSAVEDGLTVLSCDRE
jgi:hypothetical protein